MTKKILRRIFILVIIWFGLATSNLVIASGVQAQDVSQTIEGIVDMVNEFYENGQIYGSGAKGLRHSLLQELEGAIAAREREQPAVVCNKLKAFSNEVEAQKDKSIEADSAELLLEAATNACTELGNLIGHVYVNVWEDILPADPHYMDGYGPDEDVTTTVETISGEFFPLEPAGSHLFEVLQETSTENNDTVSVEVGEGTELTGEDVREEGITITVEIVVVSLNSLDGLIEQIALIIHKSRLH